MSGTNIFGNTDSDYGFFSRTNMANIGSDLDQQRQQRMSQAQAAQQQQMMYNQQLQMAYGLARQKHEWMVNGVSMNFDEFLDTICPDQDDPQRTFLTLKYRGIK